MYTIYPVLFSITSYRQMAQTIRWFNRGRLIVAKRHPPISRQRAVHRTSFSRKHFNMLLLTFVKSCLKSCYEILNSLGRDCIIMLLQMSPHEQSIAFRSGYQWWHAIGLRCLAYLPGYVAFNNYRTSSPYKAMTLIVLKPQSLSHS
jgi:hypothetical protein